MCISSDNKPIRGQPTTQARNCRKLPLQSSCRASLSDVAEFIILQMNVAHEKSLMGSSKPEKLFKTSGKGLPAYLVGYARHLLCKFYDYIYAGQNKWC